MASTGFQFKQFFVAHDQCAMKVNTDGILLGAIADVQNAKRILDMGTGTGLIAIMLAQRTACNVQITGLEVEPSAFQQATQNVANCPWSMRIHMMQADIFQQHFTNTFDLIVSNPPYFTDSLPSRSTQRDLARTLNQPHIQWLAQAQKWLSPQGKICFILPTQVAEKLEQQAKYLSLYCAEKWFIYTKKQTLPKRTLITFQQSEQTAVQKNLFIYQENHQYSLAFKRLTQDFYLHF